MRFVPDIGSRFVRRYEYRFIRWELLSAVSRDPGTMTKPPKHLLRVHVSQIKKQTLQHIPANTFSLRTKHRPKLFSELVTVLLFYCKQSIPLREELGMCFRYMGRHFVKEVAKAAGF